MNQQAINAVNRKAQSGELRRALEPLPANVTEALVRAALRRRRLHSRYINMDEVRAALRRAGWPKDEIEFALYRENVKWQAK